MQIEKDLWIEGGFYIDFDLLGQFRIIGPNNHLYLGLIDIPRHKIKIDSISSTPEDRLVVKGSFIGNAINFYLPAIDDIRELRGLVKGDFRVAIVRSFLDLRRMDPNRAVPTIVTQGRADFIRLTFRRTYGDKWYGASLFLPRAVSVRKITQPYRGYRFLSKKKEIPFRLVAETNDLAVKNTECQWSLSSELDFKRFGSRAAAVKKFHQRTKIEIEHLINWGKTSGDRFGTIFPRDWLETLILGSNDLPRLVSDFMLKKSLTRVDSTGRGWHEDVVGEYKYEHELMGKDLIDRSMIDIEPLYFLALPHVSGDFWQDKEAVEKLRRVAGYILRKASREDFVFFKKLPRKKQTATQKYYQRGNWRDSSWAFKRVGDPLAPFDVNAVFYPEALKIIKRYQKKLGLKSQKISPVLKRWKSMRDFYRFKNEDGREAYALALYNAYNRGNFKQFRINHLDESYLYFYGQGSEGELSSFCSRLLDPEYFYTPSGPIIVAKNNRYGYTTAEYHGLVIWPKQVAFVVAGLARHLRFAPRRAWSKKTINLLEKTLRVVCEEVIKSFCVLKAMPEVYFDDNGVPKFFTDQSGVEATMSKVQLWSAMGARRVFREYERLKREKLGE
jgi:hypothetical protein